MSFHAWESIVSYCFSRHPSLDNPVSNWRALSRMAYLGTESWRPFAIKSASVGSRVESAFSIQHSKADRRERIWTNELREKIPCMPTS